MSIGTVGSLEVGSVQVATTSNQGLPVDHWVERCLKRIVHVSDDSKSVIRDQARAYRKAIREVLKYYMVQAIKTDRTTIYNMLLNHGELEAAELIRRL